MNRDHETIHVDADGKVKSIERGPVAQRAPIVQRKLENELLPGKDHWQTQTDTGDDKRPHKTSGWRREPDGYAYSEKHGTCAGCELEVATGKPCEKHCRDVAEAERQFLIKQLGR